MTGVIDTVAVAEHRKWKQRRRCYSYLFKGDWRIICILHKDEPEDIHAYIEEQGH